MAFAVGQGISLGRLGPVPIRLDPSLFVILALLGYRDKVTLNEVLVWVFVAAFCILVHELGHAVAFLTFGRKPSILLYGMGGVTSAEGGMGPWSSLVTSLAGPIAGFGLGGILLLGGLFAGTPEQGTLPYVAWRDGLWACFGFGVFNLLPILPLDGGAALSSFLQGVMGPKGEQVARYVSIAAAGALALFLLSIGEIFGVMFCALFGAQNYQALKRSQDEPQRDEMRAASSGPHVPAGYGYTARRPSSTPRSCPGARTAWALKPSSRRRSGRCRASSWSGVSGGGVGGRRRGRRRTRR